MSFAKFRSSLYAKNCLRVAKLRRLLARHKQQVIRPRNASMFRCISIFNYICIIHLLNVPLFPFPVAEMFPLSRHFTRAQGIRQLPRASFSSTAGIAKSWQMQMTKVRSCMSRHCCLLVFELFPPSDIYALEAVMNGASLI
jgi:hypothetical protein